MPLVLERAVLHNSIIGARTIRDSAKSKGAGKCAAARAFFAGQASQVWRSLPIVIDYEGARELVFAEIQVLESTRVALLEAHGRRMAQPLHAIWDLPLNDHAAMDGFAVRSADTKNATAECPAQLKVSAPHFAGDASARKLSAGEAIPIATGAILPEGADAVIRVEEAIRKEQAILISHSYAPQHDIRRRGSEVRAGTLLVEQGQRIGAAEIAILAAFGQLAVDVIRCPRVHIIATGNELVAAEKADGKAQVDTNSPFLAARAREHGATPTLLGIVKDDPTNLRTQLESALADCDVLITSGGASVGQRDYVAPCLEELGIRWIFRKVAMKPGKPTCIGRIGSTWCVVLPGNPGAVATAFDVFVGPLLDRLQGVNQSGLHWVEARMDRPIEAHRSMTALLRGNARYSNHGIEASASSNQDSGQIVPLLRANTLIQIRARRAESSSQARVEVLLPRTWLASPPCPHLAVLGASGSGKTTLLTKLIARLASELRIAAIKHTHHDVSFDKPGKDSMRLAQAGAIAVALAGRSQLAIFQQPPANEIQLQIERSLPPGIDLILGEGFRAIDGPKILVHRQGLNLPEWIGDPEARAGLLAVATDDDEIIAGVPHFRRDNVEDLASIVVSWLRSTHVSAASWRS
jgi:molybdopterin molybdotransferase